MTKEKRTAIEKSGDYIDLSFNSAVLALSMCFSATICAPILPTPLKEKIHEVSGIDFDTAHTRFKDMGFQFMKGAAHAAERLTGQKLLNHEQAGQHQKKPEKTVHIGGWVFTIPNQK